jgi:tartrate-resistant acid phosphatase type 5
MIEAQSRSIPITRREAIRRAVVFSSGAWAASRFGALQAKETAASLGNGVHLLALGDYGTKGNKPQTSVAKQMAKFADGLGQPLTAVLALGDNFYSTIKPGRIKREFEDMYSAKSLPCSFYVCAGNHDYGTAKYDYQVGKLQLQLDYAKNHPESRWKFPGKWYTVELPSPENPLVKIIVLDGSYWEGALTPQEKIAQRRFFKEELAKKTKAPWTWMVNHYPLFSETVDRGDNKRLIDEWGKQLQEHDISLALAGHDHTLQHLEVEGYRPSFIVSGAGGARLYDCRVSNRGFVNNQVFGFNHIHVTPELLTVQFIDAQGRQLHAFTRDRQGKVEVVTQREAATAGAAG